jgi:serine phosphatase RsbU (regulator of sigma subunit)
MATHEATGGDGESRRRQQDMDAVAGRVMADMLRHSHLMRPDDMTRTLAVTARPLGVSAAQIYLSDLQERELAALGNQAAPDAEALPISSTLAGRAYQTVTIQSALLRGAVGEDSAAGQDRAAGQGRAAGERHQVWIPLVDGTERLGVLSLTVASVSEVMLDHYRALASLTAIMVMAKAVYSDTYAQVQRRKEMALQAELVWTYLPPRTFATDRVLVAAALEPAYEAGGDAFDYALLGDHLHVSVFDALGHDLAAGLLASVGIASCRGTRRAGGSVADMADRANDAIAGYFGDDRFVTALLCDLDLASGVFAWIPCGHPPPLLIRGRTVKELTRDAQPPLGLASAYPRRGRQPDGDPPRRQVTTERLEPGDRLLLYTDGVTEGRSPGGTPFGLQRLTDFIIRHNSALLPVAETMRRLNHTILEYQGGRLRDDATAVLVEWRPGEPARNLTP